MSSDQPPTSSNQRVARAASHKSSNMSELPNLEYLLSVQCVALSPLEIREIELVQPKTIEKIWIHRKTKKLMILARMESIQEAQNQLLKLQSKPTKKKKSDDTKQRIVKRKYLLHDFLSFHRSFAINSLRKFVSNVDLNEKIQLRLAEYLSNNWVFPTYNFPNIGDIGCVQHGTKEQNAAPMAIVLQVEQGTACWFYEINEKLNVKIGHLETNALKQGKINVIVGSQGWVANAVFRKIILFDSTRDESLTAALADSRNEQFWKEQAMKKLEFFKLAFLSIGDAIFNQFKKWIESHLNIKCVGKSFRSDPATATDEVFQNNFVKTSQIAGLDELWNSNKENDHYWLYLETLQIGRLFQSNDCCMKEYVVQEEKSLIIAHSLKIDYKRFDDSNFGRVKCKLQVKRLLENNVVVDK